MDKDFAICPAGGYPRIFRFDLTDDRVLSELDPETNVLRINKYLYDKLLPWQQQEVFKTKALVLTADFAT